jgi:hypothetical protein
MFHIPCFFSDDELLHPRPTSKLQDHPFSAAVTATLQVWRPHSESATDKAPCRRDSDPQNMEWFSQLKSTSYNPPKEQGQCIIIRRGGHLVEILYLV